MEVIVALCIFVLLLGLYVLPTYIAFKRDHKNRIPILVVNIFFGWSFVGWVACIAWSLTAQD
jgi:hypothetical protein